MNQFIDHLDLLDVGVPRKYFFDGEEILDSESMFTATVTPSEEEKDRVIATVALAGHQVRTLEDANLTIYWVAAGTAPSGETWADAYFIDRYNAARWVLERLNGYRSGPADQADGNDDVGQRPRGPSGPAISELIDIPSPADMGRSVVDLFPELSDLDTE